MRQPPYHFCVFNEMIFARAFGAIFISNILRVMKTASFPFMPRKTVSPRALLLMGYILGGLQIAGAQTILWSQDFSSGSNISDYVGSGPNLFDGITTSGSNLTWSINANDQLEAERTGTATGAATRSTDIDLGAVQAGFLRLDFDAPIVTSPTSGYGFALNVLVGKDFSVGNARPLEANRFAEFGLSTFADGPEWTVRNIKGAVFYTPYSSGLQTVTFVFNNSGSSQSYDFGDGVSGTTANDTFDLWIGATQVYNDAGVTTPGMTADITDFAIGWYVVGEGTVVLGDISYGAIPEPTAAALLAGAGLTVALLRRRRGC